METKNNTTSNDTTKIYEDIKNLTKQYPNDSDLGRKIRDYLIKLGLYGQ